MDWEVSNRLAAKKSRTRKANSGESAFMREHDIKQYETSRRKQGMKDTNQEAKEGKKQAETTLDTERWKSQLGTSTGSKHRGAVQERERWSKHKSASIGEHAESSKHKGASIREQA